MREATLNDLSDLDLVRPRKPRPATAQGAKGGKAVKTPTLGARLQRFRGRATLVIGSAGFAAIMVGIVCNAVMLQKGHHPAPLFGTSTQSEPSRSVPRAEPVPAAAPAPVQALPANRIADLPAAATTEVKAAAAPAAPPAPAHRMAHAAAHLITHGPAHVAAHATPAAHHMASAPASAHRSADAIARLLGSPGAAPLPLHPTARVRPGQRMATRAAEPVKAAAKKPRPAALASKSNEPIPD